MAPSLMESEVRSQPAMLARLVEEAAPLVAEIGRAIARRRPRFAVLAARGSSDHAAIYGKYLLETQAGLVASLAAPSVYSLYGRSPEVRDALAIGISQSGQSPDIVAALDGARRAGALALAVTNDEASPLARVSDLVLPLRVGPERSIAATKTFTAELLALWLLVGAVTGGDPGPARRVAEHVTDAPARPGALAGLRFGDAASPVVVVGRGYGFPIALEIAPQAPRGRSSERAGILGSRPLARSHRGRARWHLGDRRRGRPGRRSRVWSTARRPCARGAPDRRDQRRARSCGQAADVAVPVEAATESLAAIPITAAGQWLTLQDAAARGLDPDRPPGLEKIVRTV
jgi:glucosamine--fructose-6-phosphate aminotransferase (isomerizing)